jgi:hypothetical protein
LLIARQIAIYNGQIWEKVDAKTRAGLMTLAQSIIATIERQTVARERESQLIHENRGKFYGM